MKYLTFFFFGLGLIPTTPTWGAEDFAWLKEFVNRRSIRSVDAAVKNLPAAFRTRYSLVYATKATAPTSFTGPRVLMFGENAQLVIAFTENSKKLEVMEFNPATKKFQFHDIEFTGSSAKPLIRENNIECLGCHRNGIAQWDMGSLRPGVYGGQSPVFEKKVSHEFQNFLAVKNTSSGHRHLLTENLGILKNNNELLAGFIADLTAQQIVASLVKEHAKELKEILPLLTASFVGCSELQNLASRKYLGDLKHLFQTQVAPKLVNHLQRLAIERSILVGEWSSEETSVELARVKKKFWQYLPEIILENLAPYEFRLLHSNLDSDDYFFRTSGVGLERILFPLMEQYPGKFKGLRPLLPQNTESLKNYRAGVLSIRAKKTEVCRQLKGMSRF